MRVMLALTALAMPVVSWFSQRGAFGPDNGSLSDRYPTLVVAAGYAFAIWGVIFVLDLVFAAWQLGGARRHDPGLRQLRLPAAAGFALTAAWSPVFSQLWFALSLAVIWGALTAMAWAAVVAHRAPQGQAAGHWLVRGPLALHTGWLSLAVWLSTAQVIAAYDLMHGVRPIVWSAVLWAGAAVLALCLQRALRGSVAYTVATVWGLAAVVVKQKASAADGAHTSALIAAALGVLLVLHAAWLWRRGPAVAR